MQSLQTAVDNWKRMIGNLDDYRLTLEGEEDEDGAGSDADDSGDDSGDDSDEDGDGGDGGSVRHPCAAGGATRAIPG